MALKLDHVVILSRDPQASSAFYGTLLPLLGFVQKRERIWTDGAGLFLQVLPAADGTRPYERRGPGVNHLGFSAPDAAFVEQVRTSMIAAGFSVQPIQDLGGARALFLPDPDGLRVEVTWYPPGHAVVD